MATYTLLSAYNVKCTMYTCAQETRTFQCTCTIDRPHRLGTPCIKKVNL